MLFWEGSPEKNEVCQCKYYKTVRKSITTW